MTYCRSFFLVIFVSYIVSLLHSTLLLLKSLLHSHDANIAINTGCPIKVATIMGHFSENKQSHFGPEDGDSLICLSALLKSVSMSFSDATSVVCLGGTTTNIISNGTGRNHAAGEVYRTYCSKENEEVWVLREEDKIQTLRLKKDVTQCLTFGEKPHMSPCDSTNLNQKIFIEQDELDHLNYSTFTIRGGQDASIPLIFYPLNQECRWAWTSEIEEKAKPYFETEFIFPINEVKTNPLREQYFYTFIHQMMHSSPTYPRIRKSENACPACFEEECDCFPIDYDLKDVSTVTVTLNPSLNFEKFTEDIRSANRIPTGMFAKPSVPMIIELDDFDVKTVNIEAKLYLHENLLIHEFWYHMDIWKRPPIISVKEYLRPGVNKIMSPYGGPLTIEVTARNPNAKPIKAKITGVPMATFTLGQTTEADWEKELQKEPRWVTFQGEHMASLDVKRPYTMFNFSQIVSALKRLDLMLKNSFLISGYDLHETNPEAVQAAPQGWTWWTRDSGVFDGIVAHFGNPFVFQKTSDKDIVVDYENWEIFVFGHELGHNFQTCSYSKEYGIEITNNLYALFHCAYFCGEGKYATHCKTYDKCWNLDNYNNKNTLSLLVSLLKVYGFEPLRNMHRLFRERFFSENDSLCFVSPADRLDAVYETWSKMVGHDLTDHFDFCEVPLSDAVRQRVKAEKYPLPTVNISSVMLNAGDIFSWKPDGTLPSYALPPYSSFQDAQ